MSLVGPEPLPEPEPDLVTVVVPARNEQAAIGPCIASIQAQDYRRLQIIVVDGTSTDGTADVVRKVARLDDRVELLLNPEAIIPVALNLAVRAARGRWLVRVDAHAAVPTDYVRRAVEHLRTGQWAGVGGRKDGVGVTPAGRAIAAAMTSRFGVGNSTYHYGTRPQTVDHVPFGAYDLEVVRSLGGWDERLRVNQDFEFDHRVRQRGLELLFDPELVIAWECRQSVRELYRQYRRYGRGKVLVARLHPSSLRARHLLPPALVASWVVAAAVAPVRPKAAVAIALPYLSALVAATVVTAGRLDDPEERVWVLPAFLAMHAGWGIGVWHAVLGADDLPARPAPQPMEAAVVAAGS